MVKAHSLTKGSSRHRLRWSGLALASGLAVLVYFGYGLWQSPAPPSSVAANSPQAATLIAPRDTSPRPEPVTGHTDPARSSARAEAMDYRTFVRRFQQLLHGQPTPSPQLYNSLRQPAAYLDRLQALQDFQPEQGLLLPPGTVFAPEDVRLRVGTHRDADDGALHEQLHFPVLPAALALELRLPPHRYVERVLVRWIDTENGEVVGLEMIESDGLAGSQHFTTRPAPAVEAGSYRIELYDAGEGLERLAGTAVAVGDSNRLALRND